MAVDKLVDSTQLDADLTSVANAIRTKGGTSADLAFPAGFVSAVEAIPSGGGGLQTGTFTIASKTKTVTISLDDADIEFIFAFVPNPTQADPDAGGWKTTMILYAPSENVSMSFAVFSSGSYFSRAGLSVIVDGNDITFTTGYDMKAGDTFTWYAG